MTPDIVARGGFGTLSGSSGGGGFLLLLLALILSPLVLYFGFRVLRGLAHDLVRSPVVLWNLPRTLAARKASRLERVRKNREFWERQYGKGYTRESINQVPGEKAKD
jgi:hypothetical protein